MKITQKWLTDVNACDEAQEYAKINLNGGLSLTKVIAKLHRGDWLIWLLVKTEKINQRQAVKLACISARRALGFVQPGDERPEKAILAAEKWSLYPNEINRRAAYAAAYAAYAAKAAYAYAAKAAYADAADAAYAADAADAAAAYAADAAAKAAYADVAYAADAAAKAADAYAAATDATDAITAEHLAIADAIRGEFRKSSFKKLKEEK